MKRILFYSLLSITIYCSGNSERVEESKQTSEMKSTYAPKEVTKNCVDKENNHKFIWNKRYIYWVNDEQSIEHDEVKDLSDYKGPFLIRNAIGCVEVREGTPPRLEIQKRLKPESMDDVDTIIKQDDYGTRIEVDIKNGDIEGEGVNYILFLPKEEAVGALSVICGSIIVKFKGLLGFVGTLDGSVEVDGSTSPSICDMALKGSHGVIAKNINGSVETKTSDGEIELLDINGNVSAETLSGSINAKNIHGHLKATTSDGNIEAHNINGSFHAESLHGKIYRDGKRINTGSDNE